MTMPQETEIAPEIYFLIRALILVFARVQLRIPQIPPPSRQPSTRIEPDPRSVSDAL